VLSECALSVLDFFSVLLFSSQNSKYLLTSVKTLPKSNDFTVSHFKISVAAYGFS
jgi:hypothetical protein